MKDKKRNINVLLYLLKKLHRYASQKQHELLIVTLKKDKKYLEDCRITAFGLLRTIIFCAINDTYSFQQNFNDKRFLKIKAELNEGFSEQFMVIALENYPIYNYIIRIQSIMEASTRKFISQSEFGSYLKELTPAKCNAYYILKGWRNTIHKNGRIDIEESYDYRNKKIFIPKDKGFEFEFWTLYRISKDLIDILFELSKKSLNSNPQLMIDTDLNIKNGL